VATVALANKMARTALGVIGKGSTVPQDYAAMQQAA